MVMIAGKNRRIKLLLFMIPFLIGTGVDLYVPSLPAITNYFHVHQSLVQLTIAFYMLGYGVGQIFLGVLSDSIGRRKILLISSALYTLVSFIAVMAPTVQWLIFFRLLQGLCIAGFGVVSRAIATDCFSSFDLAKAMTFISISFSLGPVIGPFIGGTLQHYFSWKANFYFFAIYGAVICLYALLYLPETNKHMRLFNYQNSFIIIKSIFVNPAFIFGTIVASLVYGCLVMFNIIGPFIIQVVLRYSAFAYGHLALLLGFGYLLGNILNRIVVGHWSARRIIIVSVSSALLFALILLYLGMSFAENIYLLLIPVFLIFFSFGIFFPNIMTMVLGSFSKNGGTASALFGTFLGIVVFLVTSFSTRLQTSNHVPMAIVYVIILSSCLLLLRYVCKACPKN